MCRIEEDEIKKIADQRKREKMEDKLARCVQMILLNHTPQDDTDDST